MTRNEFLENVSTFGDLKDFCCDEDCSLLEDVYDEEGRDDYINECLMDWTREDSWQDLYSRLDSIPTGYDWYRYDDYGDWCGLDDEDFEDYKGDVLEWADDHGVWDDDEEEDMDEDCFEDEPEDDEPAPEEEDFSVGDLIGMCVVALGTIQSEDARRAREEEEEFRRLYPKVLK